MIALEGEKLRRLQMVELELLQELDRICRLCDIHYSIIAGTMLGAVRHGGFIPWDDDADVAMLRSEYERFREACATELDQERFYFQDHVSTPGYRWGYGKLRRKNTLFLREHQEEMPYEQGVFIDVFPLDPVPDHWTARAAVNFQCFCIRKTLWAKVGKTADKSRFKRQLFCLLDRIPEKKVLALYDRAIEHTKRCESGWVRILMFPTPNRQYGYRRYWYEDSKPIRFEGVVFSGVEDANGYLSFKFGNYREFPPEEKRKTHPVSAFEIPDCLVGNSEGDRL